MHRRNLSLPIMLAAATLAGTPAVAQLHPAIGKQAPAQASPAPQQSKASRCNRPSKSPFRIIRRVQAAGYLAAVAKAQVTEARSDYYPHAYGSATGVKAENDSRIAAGALNNPIIYNRFADGVTVEQLVTDFGRTHELVKSANLHAKAQEENVTTSRADILLQVDGAYFNALKAQAVLQVAQETVKDRQLVSDQVTEMQKNKLKSGLDVSFANVDLAQAQLLLVQAQNDLQASYAELSAALGSADQKIYQLFEQPTPPAPPTRSIRLDHRSHARPP